MKGLFIGCLVTVPLFPRCTIILEIKLNALSIKPLILRVYLAIQRSPESTEP